MLTKIPAADKIAAKNTNTKRLESIYLSNLYESDSEYNDWYKNNYNDFYSSVYYIGILYYLADNSSAKNTPENFYTKENLDEILKEHLSQIDENIYFSLKLLETFQQ